MAAAVLEIDPARERDELERYLGERFELDRLHRYQQQLDEEFSACGDEQAFYRASGGYLYNLTAFAMTKTKLPYLRQLAELVPAGARLLDYGCGIGSDGLLLLEAGYRVEFADFDNPSVAYLRWRLAERRIEAPIHDLDREVPGGFAAAFAFDVIEHVDDPFALLTAMERRAELVVVNLLESAPAEAEQALHRELPIGAIAWHAARSGLRSYSILHRRSHLIAYEPGTAGPLGALRGWAAIGASHARRRLRG